MICPKCKKELEDGIKFCKFCGEKLSEEENQNNEIDTTNNITINKKEIIEVSMNQTNTVATTLDQEIKQELQQEVILEVKQDVKPEIKQEMKKKNKEKTIKILMLISYALILLLYTAFVIGKEYYDANVFILLIFIYPLVLSIITLVQSIQYRLKDKEQGKGIVYLVLSILAICLVFEVFVFAIMNLS